MTIQVNTLKINASVGSSDSVKKEAAEQAPAAAGGGGGESNEKMIEECVERVLDVLRRELKP